MARDRRSEILDVAGEIFLDQGYAAASMSAIAARLGGSKGTLYKRRLFGVAEAPTAGEIKDDVEAAVATFMAAYGT